MTQPHMKATTRRHSHQSQHSRAGRGHRTLRIFVSGAPTASHPHPSTQPAKPPAVKSTPSSRQSEFRSSIPRLSNSEIRDHPKPQSWLTPNTYVPLHTLSPLRPLDRSRTSQLPPTIPRVRLDRCLQQIGRDNFELTTWITERRGGR